MVSILVDVTKCTGCERCTEACVKTHDLDPEKAEYARATAKDGLNEDRISTIISLGNGRFARKSCMHCLEASCVSACLVGGLTISEEGVVIYDADKCIGCRYCMLACPFHIPRYEWSQIIPFVSKCDFCFERIREGKSPACVEACPQQAIQFGDRDLMLQTARKTIEQNPGHYVPRIWGEKEFGGTSILYISDVDLSQLGWPEEEVRPIPEITDPVITKTPHIGLSVFVGSFALRWIIERRNRLMNAKPGIEDQSE
jgi:formate dehydrogenase iron-sulfur subunit